MARITKKYTMGWYGGCNCKDIKVSEIGGTFGEDSFGKVMFVKLLMLKELHMYQEEIHRQLANYHVEHFI